MQKLNGLPSSTINAASPANPLQLNDIHLPEQISNFPYAYGWWLLAVLILLLTVLAILQIKKSAKRNQVKKQALTQLNNNSDMNNSDIIALLKWAAMHYFSRAELAKLYAGSLQQFLLKHLPEKHQINFSQLSEQAFSHQYQANFHHEIDEKLQQAALLWLNHALPPKQLKQLKQESSNEVSKEVSA